MVIIKIFFSVKNNVKVTYLTMIFKHFISFILG